MSFAIPAQNFRRNGQTKFRSVPQSCPTFCDPMDCSMPGFTVHHQFLELAHTHVRRVSDAIQPSHPLLSPSPAFSLSQNHGLFQCVNSLHQVAKVLKLLLQHQSFQWIFRTDSLSDRLVCSSCSPRDKLNGQINFNRWHTKASTKRGVYMCLLSSIYNYYTFMSTLRVTLTLTHSQSKDSSFFCLFTKNKQFLYL